MGAGGHVLILDANALSKKDIKLLDKVCAGMVTERNFLGHDIVTVYWDEEEFDLFGGECNNDEIIKAREIISRATLDEWKVCD
jgi:hypothetical protein